MKTMLIGASLALLSLPASAAVCAGGKVAIIRVSTIKAEGTRAGFDKAVADQIAWYRSHGVANNRIVEAGVIDMTSGMPTLSAKEVMTIHYDPPTATGVQPPVDDGYQAFVKEFRDNSDIAVEKAVCLPE